MRYDDDDEVTRLGQLFNSKSWIPAGQRQSTSKVALRSPLGHPLYIGEQTTLLMKDGIVIFEHRKIPLAEGLFPINRVKLVAFFWANAATPPCV